MNLAEIRASLSEIARRPVRAMFPRGVRGHIKLKRWAAARRRAVTSVSYEEFADGLRSLGDWRGRVVWVQSSWNDLFALAMRPREVIDLMLDLVGPDGTLVMPAFPMVADRTAELAIDTAPVTTGLLCEMFRRLPDTKRSVHINNSVVALGPAAEFLTEAHHLDPYPWGPITPYGRLNEIDGLMVGLGVWPLGFTPLHHVECALHHEVKRFRTVFGGELTYRWKRCNGERGTHTTLLRRGRIRPARLLPLLPAGLHRQAQLSNFQIQSTPVTATVDAFKALARRNKTIYPHMFEIGAV